MEQLKEQVTQDHEKLIKIDIKVTSMCKIIEEIKNTMIVNHKETTDVNSKILDRIDRNLDVVQRKIEKKDDDCNACKGEIYKAINQKPDMGTFKWIIGGMSGLILLAIVTVGGLAIDNKIELSKINHLLEDHVGYAELVYKEVTGKDWGTATREDLNRAKENVMKVRKEAEEKAD